MPKVRTVLACLAHPDDEVMGVGGSLARCAALGDRVVLVCATRGEAGEISDASLATPETLGQVREEELRCAANVLGISELIFLDYRDSGMAGTADNQNPEAFMNAPAGEVMARLVAIIRQYRPQVVITDDPHGTYGHPDHLAIHRHTKAAFDAAGLADRFPGEGAPWKPDRLYYKVFPESWARATRELMVAEGADMSAFDEAEEQGFVTWPDDEVHLVLDVSDLVAAKLAAFACHHTQFGEEGLFGSLPEAAMQQMLSSEYFSLARPELPPGERLPSLFE